MAVAMSEADRQINQMMEFIMEEANEKAEEIRQKATAEYESVFQELKRDVEKKLDREYKAKREQHQIEKLISVSKKKQASRYSVMDMRNELFEQIKLSVVKRLAGVERHPQYSQFLTNLIVQGLIRLQEEKVVVRCREIDADKVRAVLKNAAELYKTTVKKATNYTPVLEPLTIDTKFLPGPYVQGREDDDYCSGGILLVARKGKIVCKNTLDARLDIAFTQLTPQIRGLLFGVRAKK